MKIDRPVQLFFIDFTKPWWKLITRQKGLGLIVLLSVVIRDIFWALVPFLIALTLEKSQWPLFAGLCGIWLLAEINNAIQPFLNARFQLQCIHSVLYSAHSALLSFDPHYHSKQSQGIMLAKIDRAARGYEDVLDQIVFEFSPLIVGITTMFIILSRYSFALVLTIFVCLTIMVSYGLYFAHYKGKYKEADFIKTDDSFRATALENIAQIQLIRGTFATDYMRNKLVKKININSEAEKSLWLSYSMTSRIMSLLYALSILTLIGFFIYSIQQGATSLPYAIGLILAYIQSTRQLIKILYPLRKFMRGLSAIKDLFKAMPTFGKQTIPLVSGSNYTVGCAAPLSVVAENIVFSHDTAHIFNHHTFRIYNQENTPLKLYGIIGPSGIGKTTLFSILGGQLKPTSGSVLINGINIYQVGDDIRRHLITLQNQTASSLRGSISENLLFGLPENHGYSNDYLLDVLDRVGLASSVRMHGLDTPLGEGALNLSGGQRQRLNFASLYLRALHYKPALILIDEPTSSLDEVNERAIVAMINELALHSITLVIAHRLKILHGAAGFIDLSLLRQSNTIEIYDLEMLQKNSAYYQQVLNDDSATLNRKKD